MLCPFCRTENIEGTDLCAHCGESLYGLDLPDPGPDFIYQTLAALPRRPVATVNSNDPVSLAIVTMRSRGTQSVLVMEGETLVGILTGADLLHKIAAPRIDLNSLTCKEIMTAEPFCLEEDDTIALAVNIMAAGGFRHVPVLRDGKPVTVIGVTDIFMYISPNMV